jgi:NADH dehydrogenase [ubiquinone] 1 alpha subcomplex assembly factor 7
MSTQDITAPLATELRRLITLRGPMPLARYMSLCLTHPEHGYYMSRDPFGVAGDFTTSPEISQMFGELIGLWAAAVWQSTGARSSINLVELGPGRGTLMADALRAAKVMPAFEQAVTVHLVETSPVLRDLQRLKLGQFEQPMTWHESVDDVPDGPAIIVANEFFDALSINQAVRQADGWYERTIALDDNGDLVFGVGPQALQNFEQTLPEHIRAAPLGAVFEWRSHRVAFELARRVKRGGAALIIDYGHVRSAVGSTFQALRNHRYDDPLNAPGLADLSAHVDFEALADAAAGIGARVHGPIEQGDFLRAIGIEKRALGLKARSPERSSEIDAALARLTAEGETGMGRMFKVLALSDPKLTALPGFTGGRSWATPG